MVGCESQKPPTEIGPKSFPDVSFDGFEFNGVRVDGNSVKLTRGVPFEVTAAGTKPADFVVDSCIAALVSERRVMLQSTSDVTVQKVSREEFKLVIKMPAVETTETVATLEILLPAGKIGE